MSIMNAFKLYLSLVTILPNMYKYFHCSLKFFLALAFVLAFSSCASNKKIHYLQKAGEEMENALKYENTLQPDDNLMITVTGPNADLVQDFNLSFLYRRSTEMISSTDNSAYTYLIDQNGDIDFPILGKLRLAGLTRIEAENYLKVKLTQYINNPGVNVRVTNFKVSVIGEVTRPGSQQITGDRVTIFEALSAAGDLTIYGKRKDVMIIREKDNVKKITQVDLTNPDIISSPYYYLAHNDVVYVKPNKTRVNSSVVGPNLTLALSTISLLITIITLTTR